MSSNNMISNEKLASAFNKESAVFAVDSLITALTDNSDLTFGALGEETASAALMELDHLMVRPKPASYVPKKVKNGHYPSNPDQFKLPEWIVSKLDSAFQTFVVRATLLSINEQATYWIMMFRYCFYLRNLRGEGKKERLLFYYLFEKVHSVFPKTAEALVFLIIDYGYFGDLDHLIIAFKAKGAKGLGVVNAALSTYTNHLNYDAIQVFGKQMTSVTKDDAVMLNNKLKAMKAEELHAFLKGKKLSLAAKHIPREGKKDQVVRQMVIDHAFPVADRKNVNFMKQRFRYIITALAQCLCVGEQMMATSGEAGSIQRNWDDIEMNGAPAGFLAQHRLALLNEIKNVPLITEESVETGNRSTNTDRIQCRKNLLKTINEDKLKGLQLDLSKLARKIKTYVQTNDYQCPGRNNMWNLSTAERSMISAQWNDMRTKLKDAIDTAIKETPSIIDPRNVIPMIDMSSSMKNLGVDVEAVAIGVMAASISNLPGCLITFSKKPIIFYIDQTKDVFDQFQQVYMTYAGTSTDIDAAYEKLLELMTINKVKSVDFALMILTDGHFNSVLVTIGRDDLSKFETVFLRRMEKAFKEKGFNLPRTIFWNLSARGAFSATETTKGVQMVNGYSQTLLMSVFCGVYTVATDEQGDTRVNIDPWTTFLKSITNERFDAVRQICLATKEGCFA